jgi:hypothetical protein
MILRAYLATQRHARQRLCIGQSPRKYLASISMHTPKSRPLLVQSKQLQLFLLIVGLTSGIQVFDSIGYSRAKAQLISQANVAIFSSGRTDSGSGIEQRCKYYFYEGANLRQSCSSLIDSGYTTPRARTSIASGYWDSDGSSVRVRIVSPPSYSGLIMYQKTRSGELVSPSGTRLRPD